MAANDAGPVTAIAIATAIATATATSDGGGVPYSGSVLEPYLTLHEPRLVLDLRPDSAFHQAHLASSYHISPVSQLKSRYSYLPPRNTPFLVLAHLDQYQDVVQALSSTPSARLVFLSDSIASTPHTQSIVSSHSLAIVASSNFLDSAESLGLVRTSQSHRERITVQQGRVQASARVGGIDVPQLLFRPSNAVKRTVLQLEAHIQCRQRRSPLRLLDLGCGAARDLSWILHGSRTRSPSSLWTGVGVDNWKAALNRAHQLMHDLYLVSSQSDQIQQQPPPPHCEKLLWARCTDDGFLEPLVGAGKGKSIRNPQDDSQLWNEYVRAGLQPLLPTTHSSAAQQIIGDESRYDLVLCIRFHPRPLLQRLSHLVRAGGIVLLSHFVTLSAEECEAAAKAQPDAILDYESPPHQGRIQPGEVETLIQTWNRDVGSGFKWIIHSHVLEPIEDGRIIKSVALRKSVV